MLARQKKLGRAMQVIAIIAAVLGVAIGVLLGSGIITSTIAIIAGVVILVSWFIATIATYLRGQRDLFRMLNARQELIANAELMKRNLRQAVRDLRRLTDAYAQFLAWSRVLSSVLAAPFGVAANATADGVRLSASLPLPLKLGSASVDSDVLASAVVTLRRDIFRSGWLTEPWDALIAASPATIGPEAFELRDDPAAIFRQPGNGDTSLLLKWLAIIEERGIDSSVADRLWGSVQVQLDGEKRPLAASLLGSIIELGQPSSHRVSYEAFMSGIDEASASGGIGQFDGAVFTPEARAGASIYVDRSWAKQSRVGLSRVAVLTQLSAGMPSYAFAAFAAPQGGLSSPASSVADPNLTF
jgi:xanthosine utilization system XapX-like protein